MAEASKRKSLASGQKLKIIHAVERRGEDWKSMGKGVKRGEWQERMTGDSENANTRGGTEGNGHCKKRKVNKFDNVDVECTVFENGQEAFDFKPTNREWRTRQCLRFNLQGPLHLPERIPSRHACQELAKPKQVDHIVGDGNCFTAQLASRFVALKMSMRL